MLIGSLVLIFVFVSCLLSDRISSAQAEDAVPQLQPQPQPQKQAPAATATPRVGSRKIGYVYGRMPESRGNLHPQEDLKLTTSVPKDVHSNEGWRYPWIELTVENVGQQPWYFSRRAETAGLEFHVRDAQGNELVPNERGAGLARNALTSQPSRAENLLPGQKTKFFFVALGDCMKFPLNQIYRVQLRWTINMHPTAELRASEGPDRDNGLSPTLESNVLEIDLREGRAK